MNSTNTAALTAEALPDLPTAQRDLQRLTTALQALKPEWSATEERWADSYRDAAAGMPVAPEASVEIDALIARERVLRVQIKRAEEVLDRVQRRTVIRAVLESNDAGQSLASKNGAIAARVADHLAGVAAGLEELLTNNRQIMNLVRKVRGGSTATDDGELAKGDLATLMRPAHMQTLVERDLNARLGWYRCEAPLLYGNPTFDQSVAGTNGVLMQMLDILFELPKVDQAEIDAVRAEMLADFPA